MLLLVSLIGFDRAAHQRVSQVIEQCSALGAQWRVTRDSASDLWIVDGAKARSPGAGLVEVEIEGADALRFRPAEMPHPVAFAEPVDESISTSHRCDAASMQSLNVLLTQLARWLSPKLVQQALVEQLVANGASFTRSNVVEVQVGGRVMALVDFEGDTAVSPDATPVAVRRADWRLRPRRANFIPPGFRMMPTEQVLWQFAHRSAREDLLPGRYARLPIHLRRMPQLPPRELADRHLHVLRELAYAPRTIAQLLESTGCDEALLRRDLAALYLVGSITCDPGRSRSTREQKRAASLRDGEDLSFIGTAPSQTSDLTVPGFGRFR